MLSPRYFNVDLDISRSFAAREGHWLEVRFETFNSMNHVKVSTAVASVVPMKYRF